MKRWAIYHAPLGSLLPFAVMNWEGDKGSDPLPGRARSAPTLDAARELVPPGLTREPRTDREDEASGLIETWEEPRN